VSAIHVYRLRRVESEYLTCRASLSYAERYWSQLFSTAEWEGRTLSQVREAWRYLEGTYIIRIFSEFEGILREAWSTRGGNPDEHNVDFLIDHVADPTPPAELRQRVHEVQYFRNSLVHPGARRVPALSMEETRRRLAKFAERLPDPAP